MTFQLFTLTAQICKIGRGTQHGGFSSEIKRTEPQQETHHAHLGLVATGMPLPRFPQGPWHDMGSMVRFPRGECAEAEIDASRRGLRFAERKRVSSTEAVSRTPSKSPANGSMDQVDTGLYRWLSGRVGLLHATPPEILPCFGFPFRFPSAPCSQNG